MTTANLPFALDAEKGLLGILLYLNHTLPDVDACIDSSYFYPSLRTQHQAIYEAVQELAKQGAAIDPVTVGGHLEKAGIQEIDGMPACSYLLGLQGDEYTLDISDSSREQRADSYAQIIKRTAEQRQVLSAAHKLNKIAENGSTDLLGDAKAAVLEELAHATKQNQNSDIPLDESQQSSMPALTGNAVIPDSNLLPVMGEEPSKWFEEWDSTGLREVSPWLADYIAYSCKVSPEGHPDFHIAGAVWTLSTVGARRIHAPLTDPMYTPLAIAMVARTSLFAKSTTAKAATNILRAAKLNWLLGDDETTPQKLLQDMSGHVPSNYNDMDFDQQLMLQYRLGMSGQVGWYYDEFNQLIDAMKRPGPMADFAGLIRKLDNCQDEYTYSTKSGGREVVEKPYLALLASTTPANLRKHASKGSEFWNDGFWARFTFITPPPDAWFTKTMEVGYVPVPGAIKDALKNWNEKLGVPNSHIEEILGENEKKTGRYKVVRDELPDHAITIEDEAYQAYIRYRETLRKMIVESGNQDLDGSYVRIADKALRVATLLGSLENENRIDFSIWSLAQEIAEMFRRNLHELYSQVTTAQEEKPIEETLITYLRKALQGGKEATQREIQQKAPVEIRKLQSRGLHDLLLIIEKSGIIDHRRDGKKEVWFLVH